jgi:hypothetical protein
VSNGSKRIWLASYPKSGNTWFRIFLTKLLGEVDAEHEAKQQHCDINDIDTGGISSARMPFDRYYSIDSSLLSYPEIEIRRSKVYEQQTFNTNSTHRFTKTHEAYTFATDKTPLLGDPKNHAAIYLVRNPLDVVLSYANHMGISDLDKMIWHLADEAHAMCGSKVHFTNQFYQRLLSWSQHVETWLHNTDMPIHVMRYEDMVQDTFNSFKKALCFSGVKCEDDEIIAALEASSFDALKQQEREHGFKEKPSGTRSFFNNGKVGSYREKLTQLQIDEVVKTHHRVMSQLDYINTSSELTV